MINDKQIISISILATLGFLFIIALIAIPVIGWIKVFMARDQEIKYWEDRKNNAVKACNKYVEEHNGQDLDSDQELQTLKKKKDYSEQRANQAKSILRNPIAIFLHSFFYYKIDFDNEERISPKQERSRNPIIMLCNRVLSHTYSQNGQKMRVSHHTLPAIYRPGSDICQAMVMSQYIRRNLSRLSPADAINYYL